MKKFIDKTNSLKEPAIKTGNFVPRDAINLGWFSGREISPRNNISLVDLSALIPENVTTNTQSDRLMYANQFGILEDADGNTLIDSDDISVSSIFLNSETLDKNYTSAEMSQKAFVHSYYVSRFFTLIPSRSYSSSVLSQYLEEEYIPNHIKVLDGEGKLYADPVTGAKKYRISLESFVTTSNRDLESVPHRIVVLMDNPNPTNLKLVYDKVEANQDGSWFGQYLKFEENINSVKIFSETREETETIDPSNGDVMKFSVKRNNKRSLVDGLNLSNSGNQIYVNRKALDDNRVFEIFNWRLVAKISNSVNFSQVNYGQETTGNNILQKTVKVGVLYSSNEGKDLAKIKPYVALNLQNSVFNLSGFTLANPNATSSDKNSADYWLVDIDTVSDLSAYDVVFAAVHWRLTDSQSQKMRNYFTANNGTLVIDASQCSTNDIASLNSSLTISSATGTISNPTYPTSTEAGSLLTDTNKNNGFTLSNGEFFTDCGIHGYARNVANEYKNYKYFTNSSINSVLSSGGNKFSILLRNSPNTNNLVAGNIIASTFPVLDYCNNIYSGSSLTPTNNYGTTTISINQGTVFSDFVEGPYKFLYNCMLVAINDRIESSRSVIDVRSSVHYFTTGWNNNWVINSDVLYDDEKAQYYENINNAGSNLYARNILNSPKTYYIEEIKKIITGYQDRFFDENENNISFYIEYTNPNVLWTNTTAVTDLEKNEISSSYQIKKILNKNVKCHVYTEKVSPAFVVPSGFGPYQIKAKTITSAVDKLSSFSNVAPHNYPFEFNLSHSKVSGGDNPKSFSASIRSVLNVEFEQKNNWTFTETRYIPAAPKRIIQPGVPATSTTVTGGEFSFTPGVVKSNSSAATSESADALAVSDANNAFVYTRDISEGNTWDEYFEGKGSGTFVRYIKLTMHHAGYNASSPSNGTFNASLSNEVKAFQTSRGLPADGIVDSRTKEAMAFVWAEKDAVQLEATRANVVDNNKYGDTKIWDYVNAASQVRTAVHNIINGNEVKMINFTGSSKASNQIKMWVAVPLRNDGNIEKVVKAQIYPIEFGPSATSYRGIRILDWNVSDSAQFSESFFNNKAQGYQKNGVITITLDSPDFKGKWLSILLEGSVLGGNKFGPKAAGIAFNGIEIFYKSNNTTTTTPAIDPVYDDPQPTPYTYTEARTDTARINGTVEVTHVLNNISFNTISSEITLEYLKNNGKLKSLEVYEQVEGRLFVTNPKISYTGLDISLNNASYKPSSSRNEVLDIANPKRIVAINSSTLVPGSVRESGTSILSNDNFLNVSCSPPINTIGTTFSISASSKVSSYSSGTTYNSTVPISGYSLKKVSNNQVIAGKNQANYYDGTMLLTNSNGTPFFPLNLSAVSTTLANTEDSYYSDIKITKVGADTPGLEYGFYDTRTNQFIGRTITYLRYMQSPSDIYIAVYAYDYDGNLSTLKEFTSSSNGSSYIPTSVPLRAAYPIFNVVSNNRNKIQLFGINGELNKTEPWPLSISSGSFQKAININPDDARGWKSSYSGQDLIAAYDTSSIGSIPWSRMFGRGYYDIIGERPLYNNSRSINLRQTPLHVMKGYSSDLTRKNVPLKPALKVYTRTTETSPWSLVPYSEIINFNASTGLIEFKNQIISNNEALTKVDYTIEYNKLSVKQSAGVPIPTNPFLNKDTVQLNKPLYIYVLPQKVYKSENVNNSIKQIEVTEYPVGPAINFTYNNNIFNKFDQVSYDPFAQLIGIIYVINTNDDENFNFTDLRVKGGGISANFDTNTILDGISQAVSYWDIYPPMAEAYPKGGYVMVKIPSIVKKNFINPEEVYDIVRDNLTAGVVFDLYDTDGKDWGSSVTTSS
jgi:peptidoglycan hydrolase-like protein with peptidoglycan-binding domain